MLNDLNAFAPASTVAVNKLNPLSTFTSIFLVSPILLNVMNFSFTSSFGLLIHSTVLLVTLESFPNSPLYPTVHTVPSFFTNVVWYPSDAISIKLSKSSFVLSDTTRFGIFTEVVLPNPSWP